ncbi:MAG: glycosyltransferase family 2 protein [Thermoleophilaceae bacterium]
MKLVMTLLVRDEEDILEANLDFHFGQGVDFVVAMDNESRDSTPEILERYRSEGRLHVIEQTGDLRQSDWVTQMARMAATDFGADWVINNDADEFWWPRAPSLTLKDVFAAIPPQVGALAAPRSGFVARPETTDFFADRMLVRNFRSPRHPRGLQGHPKRAHRANAEVVVERSNNRLQGEGLEAVPGWHPIVIFHYQARALESFARKKVHHGAALERAGFEGSSQVARYRAHRDGVRSVAQYYVDERLVDDDAVERGVSDGRFVVDERLRGFFERARGDAPPGAPGDPRAGARRDVELADLLDDMMLAIDEWESTRKAAAQLEKRARKAERRAEKPTGGALAGLVRDVRARARGLRARS